MSASRIEHCKQQWPQEGEQRGRQPGGAAILLHLPERRFGVLPDSTRDRVLTAGTERLEA